MYIESIMSVGDSLPVIDNTRERRNIPTKTTADQSKRNFLLMMQTKNTDILTPLEQSSISYSQEEMLASLDPKFNRS